MSELNNYDIIYGFSKELKESYSNTAIQQEPYNTLITIDEICEMLSIGKNTAYYLLKTNQIHAFRIGRLWKIPRQSVTDYISSNIQKK